MNREGKQKSLHWTAKQQLYFLFGLIIFSHKLVKDKKKSRIYMHVSNLLKDRSSIQCRTHFDKMVQLHKKKQSQEEIDRYIIYNFYYQYYVIRRLDESHLKMEIMEFLKDRFKPNQKRSKQYDNCIQSLQQNLRKLQLDKNYQHYFKNEKKQMKKDQRQKQKQDGAEVRYQRQIQIDQKQVVVGVGYFDDERQYHSQSRIYFGDSQQNYFIINKL